MDLLVTAKSLAAEFLGTCALTFVAIGVVMTTGVAVSGAPTSADTIAIAAGFGGTVAAMVAACGAFSGGHLNPAVSLGLTAGCWMDWRLLPLYWVAQVLGATLGVGLLKGAVPSELHGSFGVNGMAPRVSVAEGFVMETIGTAILAYVVTVIANYKEHKDLSPVVAPYVVGGTVFLLHLLLIPLTGCSVNPARSIAPALVSGDYTDLWVFVVGPLAGGVVGSVLAMLLLRGGDPPAGE